MMNCDMMGGGLMMVLWSVLLAASVLGGIWLVVRGARASGGSPSSPGAMDILEERYARGEIDRDEFEERRQALRG